MAGQALETVDVRHQHAKTTRQVRISRRNRLAIDLMVHEGKSRAEAAKVVGITDEAMRQALQKPQVLAYRNTQMNLIRTSEASRTIAHAAKLAHSAASEHVQLEATKWVASLDGIAPVVRSEHRHIHENAPGLTIIFGSWQRPGDDALLIDGQTHEVRKRRLPNNLPVPVPHPSMRNASESVSSPGELVTPAKRTGGVK